MLRIPVTYECKCPTDRFYQSGDTCVETTAKDSIDALGFSQSFASSMTYESLINQNDDLSRLVLNNLDTFNYYYYDAAVGCRQYGDPTKCQVLANLCVLQLYNEQDVSCRLFKSIEGQDGAQAANSLYGTANGWVEGMPWLYYREQASDIVKKSGRVDITVSFYEDTANKDRNASLTFYLARYHMNGTFLGF